ncbi:MAG: PAS domain S-box protein, partial [Candidatus Aminicenantes bacterium]|nr:PAS domain S-box protein [Candidatus Aminicenantes bacterium]
GLVKMMNSVAERLTGWSEAEAMGKPLNEVFPIINEQTRTEAENPVERVLREGVVVGLANHSVLIARDGREIPIADAGSPIRDEKGVVIGVVLVFRDQSEERAAQMALQQSEEKYRILHEFAGEAIFTFSVDLKLMEINKAACEYIGGVREQLLGKDILELGLLHPDDLGRTTENIQKILSRAKAVVVDKVRFKGKHGLYGTFQVTSTPVLRNGEIVAITNVCRDVTLEEQLYSALEASERRYRFLFNAGNDAIFVYGLTKDTKPGKFIEVNELACSITGYSRGELLELSSVDLVVPEEREKVYDSQRILSEKKHRVFERTLMAKDGRRIPSEVSSHLFELNGKPTVLAIVRDISERKKSEEALKSALKEKDVMLREIHHRVKNNMQIMSSLLRLQARQIKDEKSREAFDESQTRIRSMAMIHEKLYQSKDLASVDFADYIEKMVTHLFVVYQTDPKRIHFTLDVGEVLMDINRAIPCGLIINELVSNALKYAFTERKKGEIAVRMFKDEAGKMHLIVKDTGGGFPETIDIRKAQTLGLQIVADLTKQLEGRLEMRRDGGTEFEIVF